MRIKKQVANRKSAGPAEDNVVGALLGVGGKSKQRSVIFLGLYGKIDQMDIYDKLTGGHLRSHEKLERGLVLERAQRRAVAVLLIELFGEWLLNGILENEEL